MNTNGNNEDFTIVNNDINVSEITNDMIFGTVNDPAPNATNDPVAVEISQEKHPKKKKHTKRSKHSKKSKKSKKHRETEYFDRAKRDRRDRPQYYEGNDYYNDNNRDSDDDCGGLQCRFLVVFGFCVLSVIIGIFVGLYFGLDLNNSNDNSNDPTINQTPFIAQNKTQKITITETPVNVVPVPQKPNSDSTQQNTQNTESSHDTNSDTNSDTTQQQHTTATNDDTGIIRPVCEDGVFTALSWESMTSMKTNENFICNNKEIQSKHLNSRILTPSDPDRMVSAYFNCVNNNNNNQNDQCPNLVLKSYNNENSENAISAQIMKGSVNLKAKSMEFLQAVPQMECLNSIYNDINIHYGPYTDNDRYQECINVRLSGNSDSNSDETVYDMFLRDNVASSTPNLRVEFILDSIDLEQGFDHLKLSWMYNDMIYDHSYVTWTGNNIQAESDANDISHPPLFWNVLPGDSLEVCLQLESDESVTGAGFSGHFKIREQLGELSEWSECKTSKSASLSRWDGACGVGIHSKHRVCSDNMKNLENSTHICIENEQFLNEFCTKAKCEDIDNSQLKDVPSKIRNDPNFLNYKWNGVTRIDPIYSDPFRYIQSNAKTNKIDTNHMKVQIKAKMAEIEKRYSDERELLYAIGEINHFDELSNKLEKRLLKSLLLGRRFVVSFTGSSNTAGHDNMFMSGYSMQLQSIMRVFWSEIGVHGSSFVVHNSAVGGHLGTSKLRWCVSQLAMQDADMVFWESLMNDAGYKGAYDYYETWVRNVVSMPKHPLYGVINTGDAADRYGDPCKGKPYCKITPKVNIYWWKQIEPMYAKLKNGYYMATVAFTRGCVGLDKTNDECKNLHVTWHPGPHGHRLNAEVLAYFYLKTTLNALNKYEKDINGLLTEKGREGTVALECLLADDEGPRYDMKSGTFDNWNKNEYGTYCKDTCDVSPSWCISSYYPMPQHNRIGEFVIDNFKISETTEHVVVNVNATDKNENVKGSNQDGKNTGWVAQDEVDKAVHPLIFRKGGQAPIDHKVEFESSTVGSVLHVNVKVPSQAILVLEPISGGGEEWLAQFEFMIDNENVKCTNTGQTPMKYNYKDKGFCYMPATKGKHVLSIKYAKKVSSRKKAAIDMIVGI